MAPLVSMSLLQKPPRHQSPRQHIVQNLLFCAEMHSDISFVGVWIQEQDRGGIWINGGIVGKRTDPDT